MIFMVIFISLNSTHYFIRKILNKRELQQTAINHSCDIGFKDFMNPFKSVQQSQNYILVYDATLSSGNPLPWRRNLFKTIYQ